MRYISIKWWKEKKQREKKIRELMSEDLDLSGVWHNMLYPVKKIITITGTDAGEVSQKASAALAQIYELRSFDNHDTSYPGRVKRLHSLEGEPVMEMNQAEEGNTVKVIATIAYTQYELKPGFTEEEFYTAAEASDKSEREFFRYNKECFEFGMEDVLLE